MWTRSALLLLGALLLAPAAPSAHAQDAPRPRHTMRPFGSDAELQYLAAVDRARPSRRPQAHDACADSVGPAPGDKRIVITGRVRNPAGRGVASARVSTLARCTTAGADGGYRLELPARVLAGRSRVRVSADFIRYRRASCAGPAAGEAGEVAAGSFRRSCIDAADQRDRSVETAR